MIEDVLRAVRGKYTVVYDRVGIFITWNFGIVLKLYSKSSAELLAEWKLHHTPRDRFMAREYMNEFMFDWEREMDL